MPFFRYFFNTTNEIYDKGGEFMDEDEYVFEMFIEAMEHIEKEDVDGRLRMLSKASRFVADDPEQIKPRKINIEKR